MIAAVDKQQELPWATRKAIEADLHLTERALSHEKIDLSRSPWLADLDEWRAHLGVVHDRECIMIGFLPAVWIVSSYEGVRFIQIKEGTILWSLMAALANGPATKEDLIISVWKYNYDPLRHDSVVYAAITALRKLLSPYGTRWIRFQEGRYLLDEACEVITHQKEEMKSPRISNPNDALPKMNFRQSRLVEALRPQEFVSTRSYAASFGVSEETACRDLRELVKLGWLSRIGAGRCTSYRREGIAIAQ
jgi:DNA-binding winged helix-turn-helix (wHTH) protein